MDTLPEAERRKIAAMLNFDMLASPNFVRFVYDGDQNAFPPPPMAPPGSGGIEKIFTDYFASRGLASSPTEFSGRSDYGPFIAQGVPAGGLFTGAEAIKTAAEAATYGGAAGEQYDPCYHTYCDTLETLLDRAAGGLDAQPGDQPQLDAVQRHARLRPDGRRRRARDDHARAEHRGRERQRHGQPRPAASGPAQGRGDNDETHSQ